MSYNPPRYASTNQNGGGLGLPLPLRSDSSSPSISPTSIAPSVFPPVSSSTAQHPAYKYSHPNQSSNANPGPRYYDPHSSTAHYRHASNPSSSSLEFDPPSSSFDPLDPANATPTADRAFDAMQRELGTVPGQQGLGFVEPEPSNARGNGSNLNLGYGPARPMRRLHEEPEEYHDVLRARSASNAASREYEAVSISMPPLSSSASRRAGYHQGSTSASGTGGGGGSQDLAGGVGRPASMDLDHSMSFLLSPPTSSQDPSSSSRPFVSPSSSSDNVSMNPSTSSSGPKPTPSRNGRIFPAPLLLKGGGSTPSSPVFSHTGPLSVPRRPSASSGSPLIGQGAQGRGWGLGSSRNERGERERDWERDGPMGPPLPSSSSMSSSTLNSTSTSSASERSKLPYQRHRSQQSSTSSVSQGSYLPYHSSYSYANHPSTRHQTSASGSTVSGGSPAIGAAPAATGHSSSVGPISSSSSLSASNSLSNVGAPPQPNSSGTTSAPSAPTATSSTATGSSASPSEPPISAQALLLHIHSLRSAAAPPMALSQSQGPLPRSPVVPLNQHQRIRSAGSRTVDSEQQVQPSLDRSPPRGGSSGGGGGAGTPPSQVAKLDTVDLSHKRIDHVPLEVVEALKDEVEKLALGYNLLKDLPGYFVGFGNRLKYLNVRVNLLTVFPQVLCEMPSIEILDISRNKIRKLPQNPGTLVNLKVFSVAKNRVKRLPTWFTSMTHLKVLKLDHNPLEWPPREITTFQTTGSISGQPMSKQEEADEMQRWLPALMRWLRENKDKEVEREKERDKEKRRKPSNAPEHAGEDERGGSDHANGDDSRQAAGLPRTESGRIRNSPSLPSIEAFPRPRPRPTLTDQTVLTLAEKTSAPSSTTGTALDTLESDPSVRHSRNASHSLMQSSLEPHPRPALKAKKSLPDLRQSHADILAERRSATAMIREESSSSTRPSSPLPELPALGSKTGPLQRLKNERPGLVHSVSAKAILPTQSSVTPPEGSATTSAPSTLPPLAGKIVRSESARPVPRSTPMPTSSPSLPPLATRTLLAPVPSKLRRMDPADRAEPSTSYGRDSGAYFRRQSMLPPSTIAKTVPAALLHFADAIRGILFSLSQIYSALRQFVVFASQDRLPTDVVRLMDEADQSTTSLISALDPFDSQSRRGLPPRAVVRDIFRTCQENVATFGQLVAALQPHLKVLTGTADVRYTRTLLLMLYGAMGEIAHSWESVAPLVAALDVAEANAPRTGGPTRVRSTATLVLQPPTPSPILERSISVTSTASSGNGSGSRLTRARSVTRRHAGSFSVEDVQLGAVLPPADIPPVPAIPSSTSLEDGSLVEYGAGQGGAGAGGATVRGGPRSNPSSTTTTPKSSFGSSSRAGTLPPPGGLAMPPPMHYQDMVRNAFEQPLTPGGTGLFDRNLVPPPAVPVLPSRTTSSYPLQASSSSNSLPASASASLSAGPLTATVNASGPVPPPTPAYNPHRESRPVSTLNADETFVDQADSTIQIAFDVYGMLLDSFDDPNSPVLGIGGTIGRKRARELSELCKAGNETTVRLQKGVERVRGGDGRGRLKFTKTDARRLGDASFDFVQTVIKFARAVKTTSAEVSFPTQVREGVGQLTLATREFAKLLSQNQTSFRPTEQAQPPAPPPAAPTHSSTTQATAGLASASQMQGAGSGQATRDENGWDGGGGGEVKVRDYAMM
ncbi:hypothetical protein JCM10212_004581 [Sporobolomyces blumeae]